MEGVTLNNCETEPVHIPGCILPHGLLLVVDLEEHQLLQVSANTTEFGLPEPEELLEQSSLDQLFAGPEGEGLTEYLAQESFTERAEWLGTITIAASGRDMSLYTHQIGTLLCLELEPVQAEQGRTERKMRQLLTSLDGLDDSDVFCQRLTQGLQELTGLDRVMVYRFAADWSGEIIAEATSEGLEQKFLGHRFPAIDIPKPARDVYHKITMRSLPDSRLSPVPVLPSRNPRTGEALDMSRCILRGASEMYTEYLENMGVVSTVVSCLKRRGKLWGMIACHHHSPLFLSPPVRAAHELMSEMASLQLDRMLLRQNERLSRDREGYCFQLSQALAQEQPVNAEAILEAMSYLVPSEGCAIYRNGIFRASGLAPTRAEWEEIATFEFAADGSGALSWTDNLKEHHPNSSKWSNRIGGLLALSLDERGSHRLLWFRKPVAQDLKWCGDPNEKIVKTGKHGPRLHPRSSFETYIETVADRCEAWAEPEIYLLQKLEQMRRESLRQRASELAALNERLELANSELDAFASVASHDLKEPLRGLKNYARFLTEDYADSMSDDGKHMLDRMRFLVGRMEGLLDSLLEFAKLHRPPLERVELPLGELVRNVCKLLEARINESQAKIHLVEPLPTISGHPPFLEEILLNLISNALKYSGDELPEVEISGKKNADNTTTIAVKDKGIGIPPEKLEKIFELLVRLNPSREEGYGIGLTIVKKMVERHGGEVEARSEVGVGSEFLVTL